MCVACIDYVANVFGCEACPRALCPAKILQPQSQHLAWEGGTERALGKLVPAAALAAFSLFLQFFQLKELSWYFSRFKAVTLASEIPWICKLCFSRVPVFWYLSLTPCELGDSYLLYETAEDQFCIKRDNGHSIFLKCSPVFASSCQVLSWRPMEERWSSRPRFTLLPCQVTECLATTAVGHSFAMETTYNKPAI